MSLEQPIYSRATILILAFAAAAAHAGEGWNGVASNDNTRWDVKECYFHRIEGAQYISCTSRLTNRKADISEFSYITLATNDCQTGVGTLMHYDFDGKNGGSLQVASGGGTLGALMFDYLCSLVAATARTQ